MHSSYDITSAIIKHNVPAYRQAEERCKKCYFYKEGDSVCTKSGIILESDKCTLYVDRLSIDNSKPETRICETCIHFTGEVCLRNRKKIDKCSQYGSAKEVIKTVSGRIPETEEGKLLALKLIDSEGLKLDGFRIDCAVMPDLRRTVESSRAKVVKVYGVKERKEGVPGEWRSSPVFSEARKLEEVKSAIEANASRYSFDGIDIDKTLLLYSVMNLKNYYNVHGFRVVKDGIEVYVRKHISALRSAFQTQDADVPSLKDFPDCKYAKYTVKSIAEAYSIKKITDDIHKRL